MSLERYKAKRDFSATAEPRGGKPLPKKVRGASRFVIQKHDASRLHYDFRLEMEGVLKSWAVPKGLPWQQGEKHLAVEVEDHPIEYESFEGVIPQGNYGGGTVMVWDRGSYYVYGEQPLKSLREGKLHLVLDGQKAKGEWTLVRIRRDEEKNQWLILKTGSSAKPIPKKLDDQSAKTGRTMQEIAEDRDAEWESDRDKPKGTVSSLKARIQSALKKKESREEENRLARDRQSPRQKVGQVSNLRSNREQLEKLLHDGAPGGRALASAKPRFIDPMKPRLLEAPPRAGDWLYELKFDGIRLLAIKNGKKIELISRNRNDLSVRFAELLDSLRGLPAREFVIDGEVVAVDEEGRSSFQLLQAREMEQRKSPIYFYVFDLLQLEGKDLTRLPLHARKSLLEKLCANAADPLRFSAGLSGDPKTLLNEVKRRGLEGVIGKQRDSVYEPGRRSGAWIKLKCVNEQEFVIGGYTPPQGARKYFGAVLVGYYESKKLLFAGKVGTGFNTKLLASLYKRFEREGRDDCPFADLPSKLAAGRVRPSGGQGGQWVQGITPGMMRKMHWLNPVLVCQIKFAEWTRDGKLRQPVFIGLREDKNPSDVTREG